MYLSSYLELLFHGLISKKSHPNNSWYVCIFFLLLVVEYLCCLMYTYLTLQVLTLPRIYFLQVVSERPCCLAAMKYRKRPRRRVTMLKENDQVKKSHFLKNMASTSITGEEIRKFHGKNFAPRKEMMQDVLIIQCQIEAI